jgi:hypothetical protein
MIYNQYLSKKITVMRLFSSILKSFFNGDLFMTKLWMKSILSIGTFLLVLAPLAASAFVIDFDELGEGFLGNPWSHMGVTMHSINNVSGVFPDGSTFDPQIDHECVIEQADYFYAEFPEFGSQFNALTFGIIFMPGGNLSLGPLSTVTMDLDVPASSLSFDIGYYEEGPWGGIVYHLDAYFQGSVVASNSFTIAGSDPDARDNPTFRNFGVSGAVFDQVILYATYGGDYSMPRALIDNLVIDGPVSNESQTLDSLKALYR